MSTPDSRLRHGRRQPVRPARRGPRRGPPLGVRHRVHRPARGRRHLRAPTASTRRALVRYCLALGDDALIYSHRLQQWVARLPELEEETAVANIALDLLGQARLLLARAGGIVGQTEDQLAFFREEKEFRNVRLAEHADRDFAELVVRLLIFSTWRLALFECALSCRRRPGARGDRRQGRQRARLPPRLRGAAGWSGSATAPTCRTPRRRPPSTPCGRWPGSCSAPTPTRLGQPSTAVAFDAVLDTVLAAAGLDRPGRAAARPRSAAGPGATACTPRRWATSWPSSSPSPAPTRTRRGDRG